MKKYYRQTAVKLALILMLSGTACMFSSCDGKTVENSPVSEAENSEDKSENVSTEPIDIKDPYTAEGMEFSAKSGFYEAPFYLEISVPEGSTVYYTLDGSVPDKNSIKYSEPLLITDRTEDKAVLGSHTEIVPPVVNNYYRVPVVQKKEKATVVRTMTVDKNGTQSKTVTNTYFVGSALGHEKYKGLKIISLVTPEENLFDYEKGIYVMGKVYDDWKNSTDYDPEKEEWEVPANYKQKGREWERPASIQFFEDGKLVASEDAGIRTHGGASRSYPQKSFNVYFRKDYGSPKLQYDLFSGSVKTKSGGETLDKFDSFMLRNGGNDAEYTRFRDGLIQSLVSHRSFLTQGMEPCIVYLDGEYWGQYDITEKMDDNFVSSHTGIPAKEICIVKKDRLDEGSEETYAEWEELKKWISETDLSGQSTYEVLCSKVDMQSFMEYISAEIYIDNYDWGTPNSAMWKASKTDESNPYADGRWRFIMFDTEFSTGLYGVSDANNDTFAKLLESDGFIGTLFKAALKNEGFKAEFQKTFMDIAENDFSNERVNSEIEKFKNKYSKVAAETIYRFWGRQPGMKEYHFAASADSASTAAYNYDMSVDELEAFFTKRGKQVTKYLGKYVK